MNRILVFTICVMMLTAVVAPVSTAVVPLRSGGSAMGPISGTVSGGDAPGGLTVSAGPMNGAEVLGYLAPGARITGYNVFSNGWMQLRTPFDGGWIRMEYLQPRGARGLVTSVDYPEGCLRVRSGPSSAYQKVGCLAHGQRVQLSGMWTVNNWAEVVEPVHGWVSGNQISSSLNPVVNPVIGTAGYVGEPDVVTPIIGTTGYIGPPYVVAPDVYPWLSSYSRYGYSGYRNYHRGRHMAVGVGHRGVRVGAPGVGVAVGPRGGVGVRVGGVGVRVGSGHGGGHGRGRR